MLLTCKSCGNTYVIDDAEWARPDGDGKICEQCQEPLVPLMAGGAKQDSTTILEGYSFDGLQSSWRAQSGGAVDGSGGGDAPQLQGGWDDGGHGGWSGVPHGSMSAAVPLPPEMGSMAKPPPPGYGAGGGGFGGPPPGYGAGAAPPPTQALESLDTAGGDDPNAVYIGSNERTMALDLDNLRGNAGPGGGGAPAAPPPTQALAPLAPPGGGASSQTTGQIDTTGLQRGRKKQVIIGGGPPAHDERTAAIDLNQAAAYAARMQSGGGAGALSGMAAGGPPPGMQPQGGMPPGMQPPGMQPPGMQPPGAQQPRARPVPGMHPPRPPQPQKQGGGAGKVVLVLFLILILLGGGGAAVWYFVLRGGGSSSSSSGGEAADTRPVAFSDRLTTSLQAAPDVLLPAIAGELPDDGQIVLVSASDGLYVEGELLVPFSSGSVPATALDKGTYMPAFAAALAEADPTQPVIVLLDSMLRIDAAFPVLYTAMASGRMVMIGGSTVENPSSVGTLILSPWQWPAPPSGEIPAPAKKTDLRVQIGTGSLKVTGKDVAPGTDTPNVLSLDMLALSRLPDALVNAKSATAGLDSVRFVPAPDLRVGKFVEIVQRVRGDDYNYPRFGTLYLEPPAKP